MAAILTFVYPPPGSITIADVATETKQDAQIVIEGDIRTSVQLLDDSVATTGSAVPAKALQVSGTDGTNARALKTNTSGELAVNVQSSALPTGAATETTLAAASAKLPATLGQKADAASLAVTISTEGTAQLGSLTETAPGTDTASSGLNGRLQRIAQRLTSLIALLPASLGTKAAASSLAVTWSTEDEALVGSLTESAPGTDTASSGLNGRLQRIAQRLTSLIALLPTSLGQKTMANGFAVTIASDQSAVPASQSGTWTVQPGNTANTTAWLVAQAGKTTANSSAYNDYTSTSVTTAAYTQLIASTTSATTEVEIFDSSGSALYLATGAGGAEVNQIIIFPGGNGRVPLKIAAGTRVSIKALTATASTGYIAINFYT